MPTEITAISTEVAGLQNQLTILSESISQVMTPVSEAFGALALTAATAFTGMTSVATTMMNQMLVLQGSGDFGLVGTLTGINDTLLITKETLNGMWNTEQIVGFSDILGTLPSILSTTADAVGTLADGKELLNSKIATGIGHWIAEKGEIALTTLATTAHDVAMKALTITKSCLTLKPGSVSQTGSKKLPLQSLILLQKERSKSLPES